MVKIREVEAGSKKNGSVPSTPLIDNFVTEQGRIGSLAFKMNKHFTNTNKKWLALQMPQKGMELSGEAVKTNSIFEIIYNFHFNYTILNN